MRRPPILYARSYLYGIVAASLTYQMLFNNIKWFGVTFIGFIGISFLSWVMDYDFRHKALALANTLLVWQVGAVFLPSTFVWNNDNAHRLTHLPYLEHPLNLNPIPIPMLQNLVKTVGVNSYGGELVSREVIHQHYKIPMYLYPALVQQAQYTNALQKSGLISGIPVKMGRLDLPSAAAVEQAERVSADSYLEMDRESQHYGDTPTAQRYKNRINQLIRISDQNYLLPNLTVKQVHAFYTLLKNYQVPISVRAMFTYYLGTSSMYNLYEKDIGREREATKCQRTLGKDNPECGKVSSDMTYFIDHDNYHKPK